MRKKIYKQLENKTISRIFALLLAVALVACGSKNDNNAINDCLRVSIPIPIPIPKSATLTACVDAKIGKSAGFNYAGTWAETVDFFEKEYSNNGWEITSERIDDKPGSMKTAEWNVEKKGIRLAISLSDTRVKDTSGSLQGIVLYFYE